MDREIHRILSLPRTQRYDVAGLQQQLQLRSDCPLPLRDIQLQALAAARECRGAFLPIGVGHGKSWIAVLAAAALDRELAIVFAPASTLDDLRARRAELAEHYDVRRVEVVSYAMLSRPKGTTLLDEIRGDVSDNRIVLVLDEAHKIKRLESTRTGRLMRYVARHQDIAVIALSGTMTAKSLQEMSHIAFLCLRMGSPIPLTRAVMSRWSECIDADGRPSQSDWSWVAPLCTWAGTGIASTRGHLRQEIAREAFQVRLRSAPGVVASRAGSLGASLVVHLDEQITMPMCVLRALEDARLGSDPQGDPIEDDLTMFRVTRQLTAGYWYRWVWPGGVPDQPWLDARRAWARWVRAQLENHATDGYDSPWLVAQRTDQELQDGVPWQGIHRARNAWVRESHKPQPPTETIWLDSYLVDRAQTWAEQLAEPAILWYASEAVGLQLERSGIPRYGAGDEVRGIPVETCAMSIAAHGTGKNLQAWNQCYVLEPPSSGQIWEQLLGRTHRQGQTADTVHWTVAHHASAYVRAFETARRDANYIDSTSGNQQKLNFCTITRSVSYE